MVVQFFDVFLLTSPRASLSLSPQPPSITPPPILFIPFAPLFISPLITFYFTSPVLLINCSVSSVFHSVFGSSSSFLPYSSFPPLPLPAQAPPPSWIFLFLLLHLSVFPSFLFSLSLPRHLSPLPLDAFISPPGFLFFF